MKILYFVPLLSFLSLGANAVSFDCSKARSFSEKEICNNASLSKDDDDLFIIFNDAKERTGNNKDFKEKARILWNKREKCQDIVCIEDWYSEAKSVYSEFKYSQPNMGINKNTTTSISEERFIKIVKESQVESTNAKNDMVRGGIKSRRDRAICEVMTTKNVNNWVGKVKKLDANSDGKGILYVEIGGDILLKTWNNEFSDTNYNTLIDPESALFSAASALSEGDDVIFSGSFLSDTYSNQCAKESSLGLSGGLKEPEFIFRFTSIGKYSPEKENSPANRKELGKDAYHVLVSTFSKACVLIGMGDDEGAVNAINNMVSPDGKKNPFPINKEAFSGIKNFFLKYRNLNKENCDSYSEEFLYQVLKK